MNRQICKKCGSNLSIKTSIKTHQQTKRCKKIYKEKTVRQQSDDQLLINIDNILLERAIALKIEKEKNLVAYWFFEDHTGSYHPYSHDDSIILEKSWKNMKAEVTLIRYQLKGKSEYKVNLIELTQSYQATRSMQRLVEPKPVQKELNIDELNEKFPNIEFPKEWETIPYQNYCNVITNGNEYATAIINADNHPEEYEKLYDFIMNRIRAYEIPLHGVKIDICQIERIQNPSEYIKFHTNKQCMQMTFDNVSIQEVFHGCYTNVVKDILKRDSFNGRFNNTSKFGKGTYFSPYPQVCILGSYCSMLDSNTLQLFLCDILDTGKIAIGDSNMTVEPLIGTTARRADMLVNRESDPTIMCVPNDSNIHAKYIASFKIT